MAEIKRQQNSTRPSFGTIYDGRTFECEICQDVGAIYDRETNSGRICSCTAIKRQRRLLEKCGISEAYRNRRFDTFNTSRNDHSRYMANVAKEYVANFDERNPVSIGFFGQSGIGKTHLSIAIANELMDKCIPVLYMPFVSKIKELKDLSRGQNNYYTSGGEEDLYAKAIHELKTVKVLMIDDLFKLSADNRGFINPVDVRIVFDVVNDRSLSNLPIIVSSEYSLTELIGIDEALAGRIREMCGDYFYNAPKEFSNNYRFRNEVGGSR